MKQHKIGLVLEGGGMRGVYTCGVLDRLAGDGILPDYVIGVSAGACNGCSFVSGQQGRAYRVNTAYLSDPRYLGIGNFIKTGSLFGMDFIFDEIPHRLDPFNYEAFLSSPCEFVAGVTDVHTGLPVYFGRKDMDHHSVVLRASSALPVFSPMVPYQGGLYLDGGSSDPIPFRKALADGCDRLIVVLTRNRGYQKSPEPMRLVYRQVYRRYPEVVRVLDLRHLVYNAALAALAKLEQGGRAYVIAPSEPMHIDRFEKRRGQLQLLYEMGLRDGGLPAVVRERFFG